MNWDKEQLRVQAEVVLDNLDLTSREVDRIVMEWTVAIGSIPEDWFDNSSAGFAQDHALAKLQQIAVKHIRARS